MKNQDKERTLLKNFINGVYTKEEAREVLKLIKKEQHFDVLDQNMNQTWKESYHSFDSLSASEHEEYLHEAQVLLDRIKDSKSKPQRNRFVRKSIAVAASIAILISVSIGGNYLFNKAQNASKIQYVEEITSYGEKKNILLPDGTEINMNACSKIKYPTNFEKNKRQIYLEGEAYFSVIKDENRPFVVSTDQFNVTVLGTEFDIKVYPEDELMAVSVTSGKVQVDMAESMTRLLANEQIVINTKTSEYQKITEKQLVGIWRAGSLRFNKTPIREVVKELERVYNYRFIFASGYNFDNQITGEHHNKSLESVLRSIEQTSNIKATISDGTVTLYK